jgi:hypothetical protein
MLAASPARLRSSWAGRLGGRTHADIQRLAQRLGAHLELVDAAGGLGPDQVEDVLATLYGLYAVLRLHFVQEEENYFALVDRTSDPLRRN